MGHCIHEVSVVYRYHLIDTVRKLIAPVFDMNARGMMGHITAVDVCNAGHD
jgi:hypothetical protein